MLERMQQQAEANQVSSNSNDSLTTLVVFTTIKGKHFQSHDNFLRITQTVCMCVCFLRFSTLCKVEHLQAMPCTYFFRSVTVAVTNS